MKRARMTYSSVLIDLDGTLLEEDKAIDGARDALSFLSKEGIPFLLTTNSTRESPRQIEARLKRLGVPATREDVFTASSAAIEYVTSLRDKPRCLVVGAHHVVSDFERSGVHVVRESEDADVVVLSTVKQMEADVASRILCALRRGARFVAMHRDPYFEEEGQVFLGLGAWVAAFETASDKVATVVGKPNPEFFRLAARRLGAMSEGVVVVGDNLLVDVQGAQSAGFRAFLVETGKHRRNDCEKLGVRPDLVISSVAQLPESLRQNG